MKIPYEKVGKLEKIQIVLERIPREKENQPIKDMKWLARELRKAWQLLEGEKC